MSEKKNKSQEKTRETLQKPVFFNRCVYKTLYTVNTDSFWFPEVQLGIKKHRKYRCFWAKKRKKTR